MSNSTDQLSSTSTTTSYSLYEENVNILISHTYHLSPPTIKDLRKMPQNIMDYIMETVNNDNISPLLPS